MTLPETDLARIRRWSDARNARLPERARDQIRNEIDVDDRSVTILECRPPWRADFGVRVDAVPDRPAAVHEGARREWQIYWRDRDLKFHAYDLVPPTANVETLLAEIDADPTCIFWG